MPILLLPVQGYIKTLEIILIKDVKGLDNNKIERINQLAKKSREAELTEEERLEQRKLREEYIASFRENLRGILDNTVIKRPDGTKERLSKKK